jgi:ABC-type multidrug transport system fused ATPase/permease subunit
MQEIRRSLPFRAFTALTRLERFGAVGIVLLFLCAGGIETAMLSLVAPLVYSIIDPKEFANSAAGKLMTEWLGQPMEVVFPYVAASIALGVACSSALSMIALVVSERHAARATTRMSRETVKKVLSAPYSWVIGKNSAILVRECYDNVRIWRKGYLHALFGMIEASVFIAMPAAAALALSKSAGLAALLLTGVIAAGVVWFFRSRIVHLSQQSKPAGDQLNRSLSSLFAGIREVKAIGAIDRFVSMYGSELAALNRMHAGLRVWSSAPVVIIALFGQVGLIAASFVIWMTSTSGADAVAQIALILVVASRVVPALSRLAAHINALQQHTPYVRDLLSLREEADAAMSSRNMHQLDVPKNWRSIRIENVSVAYPGMTGPALVVNSLIFERGKRYGLVGRSGSGKSTLLSLLLKLVEPTSGGVIVGTTNLKDIRADAWLADTAYVPQSPYIFDDTIARNITYGDAVDDRKLTTAIERALLGEVVRSMPNGYNSKIGERGSAWSGGQAQRLAIARALYRGAEILLLDEATSALDTITEAQVYAEILRSNTAGLIVHATHRVATLRNADWIFVLDAGQIVAAGTFASLMETSEIFRALAAEQADQSVEDNCVVGR